MVENLLSWLLDTGGPLLLRSALKIVGASAVTWLVARHVDPAQAANLVDYLGGAAMTSFGIFLSIRDKKNGQATTAAAAAAAYDHGQAQAIRQALQQGVQVQASADTARLAAVARAMGTAAVTAPKDKASLLAALKAGSF